MSNQQSLIDINTAGLQEGMNLLNLLTADQYIQGFKPAFQSDIGTHFRHILEHYQCFFVQLNETNFRFDKRPRDSRLGSELDYAKKTILGFIDRFKQFDMSLFDRQYTISEQYGESGLQDQLIDGIETSLERELMFLQSHTVHHYAMIAAMTRSLGVAPDDEFGVAIPTRNFTKQLDQTNVSHVTKVSS